MSLKKSKVVDEPDPTRPTLEETIQSGNAFTVPWSHNVKPLMEGFDSTKIRDKSRGPWISYISPFDENRIPKMEAVLAEPGGGISSFHDGKSTHAGTCTEHLSGGLGLTAGVPGVSVTVSGKYDMNCITNQNVGDGIQISRNTSCRVGRIVLDRTPPFSAEAVAMLRANDGAARFKAKYGDYYVAGYELGADAGACMSASSSSSRKEETIELTVTVEVLFWSESVTTSTTKATTTADSAFSFCGYNSLTNEIDKIETKGLKPSQQEQIQRAAGEYLAQVRNLYPNVRKRLGELGVQDGQKLPLTAATQLCRSGLVVAILLAPFTRLNEFVLNAYASRNLLDLDSN
ncbi:hypothetical protein TWF694_000308 [Orbilia ellipsospora]|uniref:Uncharacterized protein n=1 Tax=Orbilia ellipsospora TaxID=2528407 RepID=A0AAV9XN71_9PEZI